MRPAAAGWTCTERTPAPSTRPHAARPAAPSPSWSRYTRRDSRRAPGSAATREPLERLAALGVEIGDLAGEVAQRDVAEGVDQGGHLRLGAQVGVLRPCVHGRVEIRLAIAPARQQALG